MSGFSDWPVSWPPCVRAVVLNDQGQILLLKRAADAKLHPGTWCLPGGGKEENESFYAGAVRELLEETGLSADPTGEAHSFGFPGGYGMAFGFERPSGKLSVDLRESESAEWFNPKKLLAKLFPGTAQIIEAFVGFDVDGDAAADEKAAEQRFWVDGARGDGATPFHDLPILKDRSRRWHAAEAEARVRQWASSDGSGDKDKIDWGRYARAFAWVESGRHQNFGAYKLPFADVVDGKLVAVPRGVFSDGAAIMGSRGGVDIPEGDVAEVKKRLSHYYRAIAEAFNDRSIVPPWENPDGATSGTRRGDSPATGARRTDSMPVFRLDRGAVEKTERTQQGFLKVDGYASRVGVLTYVDADGTIRRELRHPDDVTKADSLATLLGVPVTDEHPPVQVDAINARTYSRGMTGDSVAMHGDKIAVPLTITDAALVERIDAGTQRELSCGYTCDLVMEPGVWNGQPFDGRQTNIRYNHLAVVRKGRAGPDVRLRLDAAEQVDGTDETEEPGMAAGDKTETMFDEIKKKHDKLQSEHDELRAKHDKLTEEHDALKERSKRDKEERDAKIDEAKRERDEARKERDESKKGRDGGAAEKDDEAKKDRERERDEARKERDEAKSERDEAKRERDSSERERDEAKKDRDKEKGRADALDAELRRRNDADVINTRVNERIKLLTTAAGILPGSVKLDGLSDREIKVAVVKDVSPDQAAHLDSASDDYLEGAFDAAVRAASRRVDGLQRAGDVLLALHGDASQGDPVASARQRREADSRAAYKQPVGRQARAR